MTAVDNPFVPVGRGVRSVALSDIERAAVETAGLGGRRSLGLDTHGAGTAVLIEVTSSEMLAAWTSAHAVVGDTGRWPVLVTAGWLGVKDWRQAMLDEDPFDRFYFREGMKASGDDDVSPRAVVNAADRVNLDARLAGVAEAGGRYWREHLRELVDWHLSVTARFCGATPNRDDVLRIADEARDPETSVEQMLMEWEDDHGFADAMTPAPDDGYLNWFTPDQPIALALLPSSDPASVHAFVSSLYKASGYGQDLVVALARTWYQRFHALPVALWGTIVELYVGRPPIAVKEAWELARQQAAVASDTLEGPGITMRQHARALVGRPDWLLHSRP